ncbi:MAG TPA: radical SAM protein, partial [Candidatus Enterocola sp.]|nr:radical SAM protein [Candidatus Enterocola sp.]
MEFKILPYITHKRLLNMALIAADYLESVCTKKVILKTKPYAASIEPANYCNLNCPQCPTGNGSIKKVPLCLSIENFKKIIKPLLPELTYLNLYFQGEPFLNDDLAKMIEYTHKERVFTCVSTNGHFLSKQICEELKKAKLDKLIICLDGATKDTYETYRKGGDFNAVIEGIRNSVKAKLPVEVQCLLLKSN